MRKEMSTKARDELKMVCVHAAVQIAWVDKLSERGAIDILDKVRKLLSDERNGT